MITAAISGGADSLMTSRFAGIMRMSLPCTPDFCREKTTAPRPDGLVPRLEYSSACVGFAPGV